MPAPAHVLIKFRPKHHLSFQGLLNACVAAVVLRGKLVAKYQLFENRALGITGNFNQFTAVDSYAVEEGQLESCG